MGLGSTGKLGREEWWGVCKRGERGVFECLTRDKKGEKGGERCKEGKELVVRSI